MLSILCFHAKNKVSSHKTCQTKDFAGVMFPSLQFAPRLARLLQTDRLKLMYHMKLNHPEEWLITVAELDPKRMQVTTQAMGAHKKSQNYIINSDVWNTKVRCVST